jgi:hypothetical protein
MLSEGATDAEKVIAGHRPAHSQDLLARGSVVLAARILVTIEDICAISVIRTSWAEKARAVMEGYPAVRGGR